MTTERAVLAGGCLWGMQDLFRRSEGVISARVGQTDNSNPVTPPGRASSALRR